MSKAFLLLISSRLKKKQIEHYFNVGHRAVGQKIVRFAVVYIQKISAANLVSNAVNVLGAGAGTNVNQLNKIVSVRVAPVLSGYNFVRPGMLIVVFNYIKR